MQTIDSDTLRVSSGVTRPAAVSVPVMVRRGLERCWKSRPRYRDGMADPEFARYAATMARSLRREARWWGVLESWCYSPDAAGVDRVFGRAVIAARANAEDSAREYERITASASRRLGGDR